MDKISDQKKGFYIVEQGEPDMFPLPLLNQIFGREYFVRVHPPIERETSLYSVAEMLQIRMSQP